MVLALFQVLLMFRLLPMGFRNKELRASLAPLLGQEPDKCTQGQMTYQLRRLRLHGLIERQKGTHRYEVTAHGLRVASFFTRSYARLVRPGMVVVADPMPKDDGLYRAFTQLEQAMDHYVGREKTRAKKT
jgi:hypothetical protein